MPPPRPARKPRGSPARGWRALATALAALLLTVGAGGKEPGARRLRVGTSGDYAPFSLAEEGGTPTGFDVTLARTYAKERGLEIELVRFRWPELVQDLAAGRFDVAMSGVTVAPQRSVAGRFSVPVVETGAVLLLREPQRWRAPEELDHPELRIGVNAGGHLERVARQRFPHATLLAIPDNQAVREALLAGSLDAAVTDTLEAPRWRRGSDEAEELGESAPFTRDRKAYLVRADRPDLAADLDAWLLERERDGSLEKLREAQLGAAGTPVATPLGSLLAAIDERLSLMPWVGVAKRRAGLPIEAPEREAEVLDAAVAATRAAATQAKVEPPPEDAVRAVFAAQVEAAKQVQWQILRDSGFAVEEPVPDLEKQLRPALLRIGERIAALLVALPQDLDDDVLRAATRDGLRTPNLSRDSSASIAEALVKLSHARGAKPAAR
ncbi:MAG: transporter substrate-binding domain-containing protein [Candidatus Limnocylindria bacterium]